MTCQNHTLISVIIPTHNRAGLLPRAVQSVLAQTYSDYELIIVDDASTDETQKVIAGFEDSRIRSIRREQSKSSAATRNTGITAARGEYMAFLDDDDEWLPSALENLLSVLDSAPSNVALAYGWLDVIDDSSRRRSVGKRSVISGDISGELLALNVPAPTSAWLVRTSAVRDLGGFDESLARRNDADFMRRLSNRYHVAVLPEVVMLFHTEHGYARISDNTSESLSNQIMFLREHLVDFTDEFEARPDALAAVLRELAIAEMMNANRLAALSEFTKAMKLEPVNGKSWRLAPLLMKLFIWYATPLSHIRARVRSLRDRLKGKSAR